MHEFALPQQGETCESIGVLAARQRSESSDLGLIDFEARSVTAGPGQLFRPGRHQFAMLAEQLAIRADEDQRVVDRP